MKRVFPGKKSEQTRRTMVAMSYRKRGGLSWRRLCRLEQRIDRLRCLLESLNCQDKGGTHVH